MHYTEITDKFRADFFKFTDEAKNICITTHISADEDAISSILTTYRLLTDRYPNKQIQIIYSGERNDRFQSFENFEKIQFATDPADYIPRIDLIIFLDGGQYSRFSPKPELIKHSQAKKICIDHHSSPPDEFDLALIISDLPSTSEILYLAFYKNAPVDKSLAETLLLGILGDTGNFSFLKPDQTETFITAKRLVEEGQVEISSLQSRYRTLEPKILTAVGELIKNTSYHQIDNWPSFQASFLERSFAFQNNLTDREIGEATDLYTAIFIRSITGYRWGFTLRPKGSSECNISFRSLPESVNVREIAERMGIGGGHDRAAGGTFRKEGEVLQAEDCLNQVLDWLKKNEPVIG